MSRIEDRLAFKAPQDPTLVESRRRCDEQTMRRIVETEAEELLPRIQGVMDDVRRIKRMLVVAELARSDKEDPIRFSLRRLSEAARV